MGNPISNLGDYNIARDALKAVGGNWEILYKNIGDTAIAKEAPKLLLKGGWIGCLITVGVAGASYLGYRGYHFLKDRKQKIENEPALKEEFANVVEAEASAESQT